MKRLLGSLALLALVVPLAAWAARPPVEVSMLVTGTVTVNTDGSVKAYTLVKQAELPVGVVQLVQKTVPDWQFRPILQDGKPVEVTTGMTLRIVGKVNHGHSTTIEVAGASFGCAAWTARKLYGYQCPLDTQVSYMHREPPVYPFLAQQAYVGGKVFLLVEVGRDGHVVQAAARQVDLSRFTDDDGFYRNVLAQTCVRAARTWRFHVPTRGAEAVKDHWNVIVPVNFNIGPPGSGAPAYGHWQEYVRGPVEAIPWVPQDAMDPSGNADAIAAGGPFMRDRRFVLETKLAGAQS